MAMRTLKVDALHVLLRAGDARRLRRLLERLDEVQIAAQMDNLQVDEQVAVLQQLATERRRLVLGEMRYEAAAGVVTAVAPEEAAELLHGLDTDDAVDILGLIDEDKLTQILARLDGAEAEEIEELLGYDPSTAGGIMSREALRVRTELPVREVIARIQAMEDPPDHPFYVYVVDDTERLVGVVTLRALITGRPEQRIADVMEPDLITVIASADQEDVAEVVSRYDLVAVPVVDDQHRLLGVVEVDDVVDVIREEATEDILKMAGAGEQLADARSFLSSFRVRSRWLLAAAGGGLLAAVTLRGYEGALARVPELALFMPVVAGMGGNVGTQSSTIVVRGLAVGFVESERLRRLVVREVGLGAAMGVLYGVLTGAVSVLMGAGDADPLRLGVVIAAGMTGSMTIAATVGTCVPLLLDRSGVDPAVATGPFVTTAVDVLGLLFYFWLATVLLGIG